VNSLWTASRYLPILSTFISAVFAFFILARWRAKPQSFHLLWWGIGVAAYGAGTLIESAVTLYGWHEFLFKSWYIAGALLGGAPLAIGSIYLLFSKRVGHIAVTILLTTVAVTGMFVVLSPIRPDQVTPHMLIGSALGWQNVRLVSPFINSLAFLFLVGGSFYAVFKFIRIPESRHVAIGNLFIAIGAILPGIGGMGSRMGHTELLYIGEFIGVILIWAGYRWCQKKPVPKLPGAPDLAVES
jgi:hypothetical protein